jgi:hypothetical protein
MLVLWVLVSLGGIYLATERGSYCFVEVDHLKLS